MLAAHGFAIIVESGCEWAFFAAGKTDEPFREFFKIIECRRIPLLLLSHAS